MTVALPAGVSTDGARGPGRTLREQPLSGGKVGCHGHESNGETELSTTQFLTSDNLALPPAQLENPVNEFIQCGRHVPFYHTIGSTDRAAFFDVKAVQ